MFKFMQPKMASIVHTFAMHVFNFQDFGYFKGFLLLSQNKKIQTLLKNFKSENFNDIKYYIVVTMKIF